MLYFVKKVFGFLHLLIGKKFSYEMVLAYHIRINFSSSLTEVKMMYACLDN